MYSAGLDRPECTGAERAHFMKFTRTITITKIERKIVKARIVSQAGDEVSVEATPPASQDAPHDHPVNRTEATDRKGNDPTGLSIYSIQKGSL